MKLNKFLESFKSLLSTDKEEESTEQLEDSKGPVVDVEVVKEVENSAEVVEASTAKETLEVDSEKPKDVEDIAVNKHKVSNDSFADLAKLIPNEESSPSPSVSEEEEEDDEDKNVISDFTGMYEFLSNGYVVEQKSYLMVTDDDDSVDSVLYTANSVEHLYQAQKNTSKASVEEIIDAVTPRQAKRLGKRVSINYPNFEARKVSLVKRFNKDKFDQNFGLKLKLLSTAGKELVQKNSDQFWGVDYNGVGENHQGKILMEIRDDYLKYDGTVEEMIKSILRKNNMDFLVKSIDFDKLKQIENL